MLYGQVYRQHLSLSLSFSLFVSLSSLVSLYSHFLFLSLMKEEEV